MCQACGGANGFRTLPPRKEYKDRFRCTKCDWGGDAADFLVLIYPRENYPQLKARIEATFLEKFKANRSTTSSLRGGPIDPDDLREAISAADDGVPMPKPLAAKERLESIWARLGLDQKEVLAIWDQIIDVCDIHTANHRNVRGYFDIDLTDFT
jgi:hypothetical protein